MSSTAEKILQDWKEKASDNNPVKELQCRLCSETFHGSGMLVASLVHLRKSHSGYFESQQHSISSSTEVEVTTVAEENSNTLVSSSSRDEAAEMSNADELCIVEKLNQTTQTDEENHSIDICTQTDFAIPLPIPEPLKRFLCLSENPGLCRPYQCLICHKPISNIKISVMHLMKKHNISLRRDAKRKPAPNSGPSSKARAAPCAKIEGRKTARKSISSRSQLHRSTSAGTGKFVKHVLNTMPHSPEEPPRSTRDVAIAIMTSQSQAHVVAGSSDEAADGLMNLFGGRSLKQSSNTESRTFKNNSPGQKTHVLSPETPEKSTSFQSFYSKSKHLSPLKPANGAAGENSTDVTVIVSPKNIRSPSHKAKEKKIPHSNGDEKNRHQLTKEKRAKFHKKTLEGKKEKEKMRLLKKKGKVFSSNNQTPKKSPPKSTNFEWSNVTFNSTSEKSNAKTSEPTREVQSCDFSPHLSINSEAPATQTPRPLNIERLNPASTDMEISKSKNTARKTTRPPRIRTPSADDDAMDINRLLCNSRFVTTKPKDAERDVVSPEIFPQCKASPPPSHVFGDVDVKRKTSRKTTRSKMTSSSGLGDVKMDVDDD